MRYTIVLTKDEDGEVFNAVVPALPGCFSWGETEEKAYQNAIDAIKLYLAELAGTDQPAPEEAGLRVVLI